MSNLRIISDNIARAAALVASSEAGALVVDNMQKHSKTLVWRGLGTTESITATFTSAPISAVSLVISNLTSTATMRVRVYTLSGDVSPVLDTGNQLCCEYTTIDKIDFGSGALNANTFSYGGGTYATLFFAETPAEKVIIDIIDTANTNGYIEATNLVIGAYWSPVYNAEYGAQLDFKDTTKHSRTDSGDINLNRGARYKRLSFTLGAMQSADRTEFMQIMLRNGMSVPLFISLIPESSDVQEQQLYQMYGVMTKLGAFNRYKVGLDKSSVQMEEI